MAGPKERPSAPESPPPGPPGQPPQPALAHVYGIEDPFRELLQLVRGILGLLLQPQVVLPQVLDFCLQVGLVFLFLGGRAEKERAGTQQLEGWQGSRVAPSPISGLHPKHPYPWPDTGHSDTQARVQVLQRLTKEGFFWKAKTLTCTFKRAVSTFGLLFWWQLS